MASNRLKKFAGFVLVASAAVLCSAPNAHAAEQSLIQAEPIIVSPFCSQIFTASSSLDQAITENENAYKADKLARTQALIKSRSESDKSLAKSRIELDAQYAEQYASLSSQVKNKAQKDAVSLFQKTMSAAIQTRRKSVDSATKTYRTGIDAVIAYRSDTYSGALAKLRSAVSTSLTSVKTDCSNNPTLSEMPASMAATIQAARAQFKATIEGLDNSNSEIDILTTARDSAIATAETIFKLVEQAANAKIKAAFAE